MKGNENTLAARLQKALMKYSGQAAIQIGKQIFSYKNLLQKSLTVSQIIDEIQVSPILPVAVLGGKSFETYTGICGALFASRAYMPLNLKYPAARNLKMLELSGARIIFSSANSSKMLDELLSGTKNIYHVIVQENVSLWEAKFPKHQFMAIEEKSGTSALPLSCSSKDTAYLLFTSGTTGIPKGVPVSNRNVLAYLDYVMDRWDFSQDDRFSHTFDLTFDLSVHDMFVCWLAGGCLCIPEDDTPFKLAGYIKDQQINVWFSVPSAAVLMNKMRLLKGGTFDMLRLSFFCGEPLPDSIADKWFAATNGHTLVNLYGPSEATIAIAEYTWTVAQNKSKNGIVCIGQCFPDQQYLLLEKESMQPNPDRGELCLGGSQVIDAYLNDENLSREYFVQVAGKSDKTWYRTGDLVEKDEDGDLFFLGRIDAEVKITGYRVNLLEVDAVLKKAGGGMAASILDEQGSPRIVSFLEKAGNSDENEIVSFCRKELPWYMIPEVIIFVDEIPLNVNGKIDRNKLKQSLGDA